MLTYTAPNKSSVWITTVLVRMKHTADVPLVCGSVCRSSEATPTSYQKCTLHFFISISLHSSVKYRLIDLRLNVKASHECKSIKHSKPYGLIALSGPINRSLSTAELFWI